jgi:hypothetical protein
MTKQKDFSRKACRWFTAPIVSISAMSYYDSTERPTSKTKPYQKRKYD